MIINPQDFLSLKNLAKDESNIYFDLNIRSLQKDKAGHFDPIVNNMDDNDVDAFRHAYTSGRYVQTYNTSLAAIAGLAWELWGNGYGSFGSNPILSKRMDLWNNKIGRKYGKKTKSKEKLAQFLHEALKCEELVIDLSDPRIQNLDESDEIDINQNVYTIKQSRSKRNELFLDIKKGTIMTRDEFVLQIKSGKYPGHFIANIGGMDTPKSKPDRNKRNNLA